ncbi:MAG: type VI secretion system baseplate subunit TssK [Gemmatimonadaceae bacterium]|jgi:type VI secretion system protein ImpJ|nr:type VI secretion system baseplate subunit TssK [Gemmatimonadaceae bacterium]
MSLLSRVVWQDGMHLAQHHFQAQARYAESAIHFAVTSTRVRPDGFVALEIDQAALRNGQFALRHARGTMPDGLSFRMPEGDALPDPVPLADRVSPVADAEEVLLAVPRRPFGAAGTSGPARYVPTTRAIPDETTGTDPREVTFAAKAFRLVLRHEVDADDVVLPIARVRRDGTGHFALDERFVPPCTQLAASPRLMTLAATVGELLEAKSDALRRGQGHNAAALRDHAANEIASFWLLHTVHAAMGPVGHLARTPDAHPEALFLELSRLAGALCTFALDAHPRQLPAYDHDALGPAFDALERALRAQLEVVLPTSAVRIPMTRSRPTLHTARVQDDRAFRRARWLLEVSAAIPEGELVRRVPALVKVAPVARIAEVVQQAKSALPLTHLSVPPTAISPRSDAQYFVIEQGGPFWDALAESRDVAAYVPDGVPDASLTLCIVLAS